MICVLYIYNMSGAPFRGMQRNVLKRFRFGGAEFYRNVPKVVVAPE